MNLFQSLFRSGPILVTFEDRLAPLPEDSTGFRMEDQIGCRVFGSHLLRSEAVTMVQFPEQERGDALSFAEVVHRFNMNGRIPGADQPYPPHIVPFYVGKQFTIPPEHSQKKVVCMGLIFRDKRGLRNVRGVEPICSGGTMLIEADWDERTLFTREHVFAVSRQRVVAPHGVLPMPAQKKTS